MASWSIRGLWTWHSLLMQGSSGLISFQTSRLKDVTPDPAFFELFIESSKTDQYVRVSLYHVVKTGADLCRWANLVNYIYASQPKLILPTSLNGGDDFLFGNIQTKSGTQFCPRRFQDFMHHMS